MNASGPGQSPPNVPDGPSKAEAFLSQSMPKA